ncbi:MAG: mycothiol synthase [Acidimicrobiales bacterium]|nr:MAG: mycothiol synthase [Acidimicrobiales bacterium]
MAKTESLRPEQLSQVLQVVEAASATDGVTALSDSTLSQLNSSAKDNFEGSTKDNVGEDAGSIHLLSHSGDEIVGYGYLAAGVGELVVHPTYRRRGLGRQLAEEAIAAAKHRGAGELRLWAHGQLPGAVRLAEVLGFWPVRTLWQLRRPLSVESTQLDELKVAAGIRLRRFQPGSDEDVWLALNRRAFAGHPEQGRWELSDVIARYNEPWFDAEGFLLAERVADQRLLGFHWTKISRDGPHRGVGEVYVLGVDPQAHGTGLGRALLVAGLRYLAHHGCVQAMLYLDADNTAAARLYYKLDFTKTDIDVQYARST